MRARKVEGLRYGPVNERFNIPEMWIAGFLQGHPELGIRDAVSYWLEQGRLQRQEEKFYGVGEGNERHT